MTNNQKQKLVVEYNKKEHLYLEFTILIRNLLDGFLSSENFKFQIFHRTKDKDRFIEKIDRKTQIGKKYKTLNDIEDISGVRIVFYLEEDKKKFIQQFFKEFENCIVSNEEKNNPNGYKGSHFIFCLNKNRTILTEYQKYTNLRCEIQVSTILFHAWSEVEHDIIYKPVVNKKLLQTLGLDDLKRSFEKVMTKHLQAATYQFDYINKKYTEIVKAGKIFDSDFINDISISKNNDEVYDILEITGGFYYKKPEELLDIINTVIRKKPLDSILLHNFGDHKIYGKTHKNLIIKCLELLIGIRYSKPNEVLNLLTTIHKNKDKNIKAKAGEVVKKFSKYDFNVLNESNLGYGPQRKVLDFVLAWSDKERLKNVDFIKIVAVELLNTSVEGTTMKDEKTIVFHTGAINPSDFLKKIRRETMDLIFELYKKTKNPKEKLELVKILENASQTPMNSVYKEDLSDMVMDDVKYLIDIYRKIVFGDLGKIVANLATIQEIEDRLSWFVYSKRYNLNEVTKLLEDIRKDDLYNIYSLFVGEDRYGRVEKGWDVADKEKDGAIKKLFKEVKKENINKWIDNLNIIAKQKEFVEQWNFQRFKLFLRGIAGEKSELADLILNDAFRKNKPLKSFTTHFLDGFRDAKKFNLWDKYIQKISKEKNTDLVSDICFSLVLDKESDIKKEIRTKDIDVLEDIVKKQKSFLFLKKVKGDKIRLHYSIINALIRLYRIDKKRIEELIVEEIKNNPNYINSHFDQLSFGSFNKWVDISEWSSGGIKFIVDKITDLKDINYSIQELILVLAKKDFETIENIFIERIKKSEKRKASIDGRYEIIPYHFNPHLKEYIATHKDYPKLIEKWFENVTENWSIYDWELRDFLQRIGGPFEDILLKIIQKGGDKNLMKAMRIVESFDGVNFNLCIEIIKQTDSLKIWDRVEGAMYTTGVVSGEYGIADAYKGKAKELEKYKEDENPRVKKFAKQMIKKLEEREKRQRQESDEEIQLRKLEFEG